QGPARARRPTATSSSSSPARTKELSQLTIALQLRGADDGSRWGEARACAGGVAASDLAADPTNTFRLSANVWRWFSVAEPIWTSGPRHIGVRSSPSLQ